MSWKSYKIGGRVAEYRLHKPGVGFAHVLTTNKPNIWYWVISLDLEGGGYTGLTDNPLLSGYGALEEAMDRAEETLELVE